MTVGIRSFHYQGTNAAIVLQTANEGRPQAGAAHL
jgi:hypothetical protein